MRTCLIGEVVIVVAALAASAAADPPGDKKWRLTFAEEFEGERLEASKWSPNRNREAFAWNGAKGVWSEDHAALDGKGNFVLKVSRDADGAYRYHNGIQTKGKFQQTHGYFETRARFTRQPGWWGAVWLYGVEVGPNPFLMGQEIDLFEDFYKPKKTSDFSHNVHFDAQLAFASEDNRRVGKLDGNTLYRVSRGEKVLVDDWDAFHVVGVLWTPLEYVFYCDGKETFRLDYRQVPVTNQPMHVLVSGCFRDPNRAKYQGDYADGVWPDQLTVDYIRVYEEDLAGRKKPEVSVRLAKSRRIVTQGEAQTFEVSAEDADGSVAQILLFNNGRLRGEQAGPRATFDVPGDQIYGGKSIFIAMARDNDGLIGLSQPLTLEVRGPREGKGTPYLGKPQVIPGKIVPGYFDNGGQQVAYFSHLNENSFGRPPWNLTFRTGEGIASPKADGIAASHRGQWVTYTAQVEQAGAYDVVASIARPDTMLAKSDRPDRILLEIDGEPLAEFSFSPTLTTGTQHWANYRELPAHRVQLAEGRHVLRVAFDATPFNFGGLEFRPSREVREPSKEPHHEPSS